MKHKIPDPDAEPKRQSGGRYIIESRMVIAPAYEHSTGPVCGQWTERQRFTKAEDRNRVFAGIPQNKDKRRAYSEFRIRDE